MARYKCPLAFGLLFVLVGLGLGVAVEPAMGQQGVIAGRVEDSQTGLPLPAAQVFISDLDIGVLSQANGRYILLNVPVGTHTITAERIGYRSVSQQVTVGSGETAVANFLLAEEALQLNEVIVTGTPGGTQRRALGNVVSRMDATALQDVAPAVTLEQMVSSRVPGLATMSAGGFVGAGVADLRIRGSSSVGLPNDPLIYIDGVRVNTDRTEGRRQTTGRLNDINPEDIESIEVIKGPAASTLYGTEASNGVIQIITKRGQTGAPRFDASVEMGANYLMDPAGKMFTNYATSLTTGELLSMNMADAYEARNGKSLFQNGLIQKYGISAQGGTDLIRYFVSYNRNDQDGPVSWNWDLTQTGRLNLDLTVNDQLSFGVNGSLVTSATRLAGDFWVQTMRGSPLGAADYGGVDTPLRGWGSLTPEALRDYNEWRFDTQRKNFSITGRYNPASWLQTRVVGGVDLTDQVEGYTVFREPDAPAGIWGNNGLGVRDVTDIETQLSTLDASATASYPVTDQLGTATSAGFQYYKKEVWTTVLNGDEFATELLSTVGAAARTSASEDRFTNVTVGSYVQEQLDWEQRIFLTGALRFDQNSAFGADYGVQVYPKVSAAWTVSDESFWNVGFVNTLRLRGAWGAAGRQPDVFAAQRLYSPATGPNLQPILTPSSYGNADLGPERAQELELGFDASFLDERVQLEYTHYWKSTKDAIVDQPVIGSLGFPGSQFINAGQIDNWGDEVSLGLEILREDPLRWNLDVAFATMDNKIVSLGDVDRISLQRSREHIVGFPLAGLHDFKVVSADFVSGNSGDVTNIMCDAGIPSGAGYLPGGAAVPCDSDAAHRVFWGSSTWKWTVNATSTFTLFQNLRLFATVEGRGGGILHADQVGAKHTSWHNSLAIQEQTDPIFMGQLEVSRNPTGYVDNGYFSLDEVGFQYTIPSAWIERLGADRASVSASVRNLGFIWRQQWYTDIGHVRVPDVRQSLGNQEYAGQQDSQSPLASSAVVTFRVSF